VEDLAPLSVAVALLTAAVLTGATKFFPRTLADALSIAASTVISTFCLSLFIQALEEPFVYWFGGWEPRGGIALGISFSIDAVGAGLASFTAILVTAALVYSWRYLNIANSLFHALVMLFLAGMVGFSLTGDLFNSFVFFELMGVSAYGLTGYRIEEGRPLQGAFNFAVTNSIGGLLILTGIALVYGRTGALNLAQIGESLAGSGPDGLVITAFVLLTSGYFVKAAIAPFHFWLPDAHAVAPTPICIIFSGAMVELGLYAVARVYWTAFSATMQPEHDPLRVALLALGAVTALGAAIVCFEQLHIKRLLAFSTVSHMGMFLVGFALLDHHGIAGVWVYFVAHGLVKAALFMGAGILVHRFERVEEIDLRGRGRGLWVVGVMFVIGGLAIAGLPPFGTFLGKAVIEEAATLKGYPWVSPLFLVASALTGGAVLRAAGRVFVGWSPPYAAEEKEFPFDDEGAGEHHSETVGPRDLTPWTMVVPMALFLIGGLAAGLWEGTLAGAGHASEFFMDRAAYAELVLADAEPPAPSEPPPHEPLLPSYLYAFGGVAAALAFGVGALFRHHFPQTARTLAQRVTDAPVDRLRALHSGHVGDYVAWIVIGIAVLGAGLAP
jgi:multicomponent Na+:H+ antiporter subunit D